PLGCNATISDFAGSVGGLVPTEAGTRPIAILKQPKASPWPSLAVLPSLGLQPRLLSITRMGQRKSSGMAPMDEPHIREARRNKCSRRLPSAVVKYFQVFLTEVHVPSFVSHLSRGKEKPHHLPRR